MYKDGKPACDGLNPSTMAACGSNAVTHIDVKGFIYCEFHGVRRKQHTRCRKLKAKEIKQLESGNPVSKY